ncbi:MAG: S-layer homology domain-containing protein [Oscillospiraceae bacterium]|nr:S-layer homology domain-containing protein [Oscillospiraceae bacterium]
MKKKLIRLASIWLAVLMLATTTFATTAFAADTGTKTNIRFFYSHDEDDYLQEEDIAYGVPKTLPLTEGKVKLSDFIGHANPNLALNVHSDFEITGWILWEIDAADGTCEYVVDEYDLDHEFVASDFPEDTYTRIIEPIITRVKLTGTVLVLSCEDDILNATNKYLSEYNSSNNIEHDYMASSLSLADDEVTTMAGEPGKGKFLDGWQLWRYSSSGWIRLSGEEPIAEYEVDGEIPLSDIKQLKGDWGALAPVLADYEITHQPTDDEPFVETNCDSDIKEYRWFEVDEAGDVLVDGADEETFSGVERNGKEYYAEVEYKDGTILTSDSFVWEKPVKKPSGGGGGLKAGGDMSTTGADKFDEDDQAKPEDSTPVTPPTTPTTPEAPSGELESGKLFDDVPAGSWFEAAAEWMGQKGYMSGTAQRTFSPNLNTTRGMIVTVLWRMAGSPAPKGECSFEDVKDGSYYEDAITWAQENGVVTGHSDTIFKPDDLITREQLATIIFRNEVRKGMDAVTMEENLAHFTDAEKISEYAVGAMNWAVGQKIINGITETLLAPQKEATRAECATILYRMNNK